MATDPIFLRPPDGWVGDVIPFAKDDRVYIFFLNDRRDPSKAGTSWDLYTTKDFASYEYHGVSLPHGRAADQDLNAYTGSVVESDGIAHVFYTGVNPEYLARGTGEPAQVVMHATSVDGMQTWTKHFDHSFGAAAGYKASDWRDPFVFRPDPNGPWHMLLAARSDSGPARRDGLIAQCVSDDLVSWKVVDPFWSPHLYITHECPEVFSIGEWWYLVYSEFSERFATRYRMSRSPFGPWTVPVQDSIDGRAFYAAKSVEHRGARYFAGWIPTREGDTDDGPWQWAGDLAVHEAVQSSDGTLDFRMPSQLRASFPRRSTPKFRGVLGDWRSTEAGWQVAVPDSYGVIVADDVPDQCLIELNIDISAGTVHCGLILRSSADGEEGYVVRLEPRVGRMVFDRWPRKRTGRGQWQISGDISHLVELERPIEIAPGRHRMSVLLDGTACVAYLDDKIAMSSRMYDRRGGALGQLVAEGAAAFTDVSVSTRQ